MPCGEFFRARFDVRLAANTNQILYGRKGKAKAVCADLTDQNAFGLMKGKE